ncbi:MAG: dipeptidyl peptidase 3 [Bacteroidales bacterium]|jgi:dipeptidyl-peptidase-3|nr:dipeptidyl peptidase 3 [Bacteroidales bacterium]
MKKLFMLVLISGVLLSCTQKNENQKDKEQGFKYLVDEFADLKIMRYQIPNWDTLTLQQKEYIYYLSEAAKCGRDILWDQNFKYNLVIRKTIENIIETYVGDKDTEDYNNFIIYAKRVFFSNGIHHHYAEDKILPDFSKDYFKELIIHSNESNYEMNENQNIEEFAEWISEIVCNAELYKMKNSKDDSEDILSVSAMNFYENITATEATDYYSKMEKPNDTTPISYGLNSKLIKKDGKIIEEVYKIGGLYNDAIQQIIFWLEKAKIVAENEQQKKYTQLLIDYYKTGDLKTWDEYNIAWVKDSLSTIDYVNGFIENYGDPLGIKATWEAVVNFKDFEATKLSNIICENAQWFEDNAPIDPRFRKEKVKGISAKGIIATTLGGDNFPSPPIGINLPNADWIRKDFGSKSVTITNLMEAYDKAAEESPNSVTAEFAYTQEEIDLAKKYGSIGDILHTDLHECLGHGSGQLLPGTSPNSLLENSSALEEARADLFALYYMYDQKLIDLGVVNTLDVAKSEYNSYIRNGLFTQFARIELGKTVTEAHMQARKLIADYCFDLGKKDNVIEKIVKDNKTYFVINDYNKLRTLFGKLLAEIQRIKSEGDYESGKQLMKKYAINIDPAIHKEVKERYAKLNLKPYGGFINPEIIAIEKDGKIIDVQIKYPMDFLEQHLGYGKNYGFLK